MSAWITADRPKPRMSAQVISQVMDPVISSACPMAAMPVLRCSRVSAPPPQDTPIGYLSLGRPAVEPPTSRASLITTVFQRGTLTGSMGRRNLAGSGLVPLASLRLAGVVRGGRGQAGPATCLRHGAAARLLRNVMVAPGTASGCAGTRPPVTTTVSPPYAR